VALIDPSAAQVMTMASELMVSRDTIRRQRTTIWGLVAALRASQQAQVAMADLLDQVLAGDG
jgi:hypothetical protein